MVKLKHCHLLYPPLEKKGTNGGMTHDGDDVLYTNFIVLKDILPAWFLLHVILNTGFNHHLSTSKWSHCFNATSKQLVQSWTQLFFATSQTLSRLMVKI